MDYPANAHGNKPEWFDAYAREALFLLAGAKTVVDAGCGSGDLLIRLGKHFNKIIGVDYSAKMIAKAQENVDKMPLVNIELFNADLLELNKVITTKVDCIYNREVVQYLTVQQINEFIVMCKELLNPGGSVLFMNVPDVNCRDLYAIKFFRAESFVSVKELVYNYLRFKLYVAKNKMKERAFKWDSNMGIWHSKSDFTSIAKDNQFSIEFYNSFYPPYGYRFHAKLTAL